MQLSDTCLDDINSDIADTSLDLLFNKLGRYLMDAMNANSILCCQSRCSSHSIAAMNGDDFLVGFKPADIGCVSLASKPNGKPMRIGQTYAPPLLSLPAITKIRFIVADLAMSLSIRWSS